MKFLSKAGVLPMGFKASGVSAKIKKSGKKDLALFYSKVPCVTSALFTSNRIKAAPIKVCQDHLRARAIRAVIANSGNANCMTGQEGVKDAFSMAQLAAEALSLKPKQVLVSSTGVIGKLLPMAHIKAAIPNLVARLASTGLQDAASAILTTDTFAKIVSKKFKLGKNTVTISGVAKGAGMIAPQLKSATMLSYIFTDALISKPILDKALKKAVEESFNAITIDGCMSTNDTVAMMANGQAKNKPIRAISGDERIFSHILKQVCLDLAKMIVWDAEGATKFIEIKVRGVANDSEAKKLAFAVANSNLFKCAMFGSDPNWGRISAALGSASSQLRPEKLDIYLNKIQVFKKGKPVILKNKNFLRGRMIDVDINLNIGKSQQCVYTSDLSYGYVRINAEYS